MDASRYQDWPEDTPLIRGESEGAFETVAELLNALEQDLEAPSFFELSSEGVQAFFTPDMSEDLSQDLATALRLAEKHGGKGLIGFIAITEEVACALPIGEGAGLDSPAWMPAGEVLGPEVIALPFIAVMDYVRELDAHGIPRGTTRARAHPPLRASAASRSARAPRKAGCRRATSGDARARGQRHRGQAAEQHPR